MATIQKCRNRDGSTSYDATVRIVGYSTNCKTFRTKLQAQLWTARTETAANGGTLACGRGMTLADLMDERCRGLLSRPPSPLLIGASTWATCASTRSRLN